MEASSRVQLGNVPVSTNVLPASVVSCGTASATGCTPCALSLSLIHISRGSGNPGELQAGLVDPLAAFHLDDDARTLVETGAVSYTHLDVYKGQIMCYALFACAFNLLLGFTGLLSFGHAAFLGSAAYAAGHALKVWGVPTEIGLLFGVAVAALLGLAMGCLLYTSRCV